MAKKQTKAIDMKWISVKDKLPENETMVFVVRQSKHEIATDYVYYEDGFQFAYTCLVDGCGQDNQEYNDVTHWMLIPKPPKSEK